MKYSDQIADWLVEFGYTHCFYVAGGNIMHLLESFSRKLDCRPTIHEVAAGVAVEYFNETSDSGRALALVTAGPGLTNIVSAIAGSYLESRELLVIGGQVKTADLSNGKLRQNGIQEIPGVDIVKPICNNSLSMLDIWSKEKLFKEINYSNNSRKGPVFIEIPLDVQAKNANPDSEFILENKKLPILDEEVFERVIDKLNRSTRPIILLGGGIDRETTKEIYHLFERISIPIVTTWNGADRLGSDHPNYMGRPNTWGQRSANILMQQADLLIAIGTRLGMQQTGFNWQEFIPVGEVIQIDIDKSELEKEHPKISLGLAVDANNFLVRLLNKDLGNHSNWLQFCQKVRQTIPIVEDGVNKVDDEYVSPHKLVQKLSSITKDSDIIIPCSSGGAFTTMMSVFEQKNGQKMVGNKGLASMGYGLSGAIGASSANPNKRVILVEGDGGFAQNLQEIGTAVINNCNIKVFILDDGGYASIRMTQRNYFSGKYVGCDIATGLGLPDWEVLFNAWGVEAIRISPEVFNSGSYIESFEKEGFSAFIVSVDPEQTYFPKISSRVTDDGKMESNPLHVMTPELEESIKIKVFEYLG